MNIGLLGAGKMAAAMGERLISQGHHVTVWNRTIEKTAGLVKLGATAVKTPAEVVVASEIIISMVLDATAYETVFHGPNGALSSPIKGKLFIEMSTVRPVSTIGLATEIYKLGGGMVDCPVGGTVGPAKDGKLLGVAGGTDADFAKAKPILDQLCRRVEHVGEIGSGTRLKLAINLPLLVFWQSFSEALSIASELKIPKERLLDILADTNGAPGFLKMRAPAIAQSLNGGPMSPASFTLDGIRKDLRIMVEEARAMGWDIPVTAAAMTSLDKMSADGLGDADGINVPAWFISANAVKK